MNINWTQPITVYELIAIALSTIALIIPLIKYIYNHFIKSFVLKLHNHFLFKFFQGHKFRFAIF